MTARVTEKTGQIRGVNVRWIHVVVEGHTVEQMLQYDVAEAEAVYERPFDDEMDKTHPDGNVCHGPHFSRWHDA